MDMDSPPIAWPFWRRIRFFGGMGLACGAMVIGLELLVADIAGGRAFNQFTPGGAVPLWPMIRMIAIFAIAGPLAIAVSLPLYRRRHGWVAIAAIVYLVFMGSALGSRRDPTSPGDWVSRLQWVVAVVGIAVMIGTMAHEGRSLAFGQPDDPSSEPPAVT
jgi:hypothetical protein